MSAPIICECPYHPPMPFLPHSVGDWVRGHAVGVHLAQTFIRIRGRQAQAGLVAVRPERRCEARR